MQGPDNSPGRMHRDSSIQGLAQMMGLKLNVSHHLLVIQETQSGRLGIKRKIRYDNHRRKSDLNARGSQILKPIFAECTKHLQTKVYFGGLCNLSISSVKLLLEVECTQN